MEKELDMDLDRYINGLVKSYAQLLKLQDWTIHIRFGTIRELPDNCEGCMSFDRYHAEAEITILHPDQAEFLEGCGPSFHEYDIERTVVHEMVHLRLIDNREDEIALGLHNVDTYEERAINAITDALVELVSRIRQLTSDNCKCGEA